ncbi:MAG: hypothetical protein M3O35_10575, partial [Acidobacteriota bacterium]|nr:hypothetical protein [Acidobacteriota bacterium]
NWILAQDRRLLSSGFLAGAVTYTKPIGAARVSKRANTAGVIQLAVVTLPDGRGSESAFELADERETG